MKNYRNVIITNRAISKTGKSHENLTEMPNRNLSDKTGNLRQNGIARTKFLHSDKMNRKSYKDRKTYIPHIVLFIEDEKMKTKIEWTEVFGLTRNKISKIRPDLILRIPGHIFLNLDEIDNNDKEEI